MLSTIGNFIACPLLRYMITIIPGKWGGMQDM
jgi:hypothetical protein